VGTIYGRPRAVYLPSPDDRQPMLIENFDSDLLAVIKLNGTHQPNAQVRAAIGGETFINAFKQRLSMVTIEALEVRDGCNVQRASEAWQKLYIKFKLNGSSEDPLRISVGGMVLVGRFNSVQFATVEHKGFNTLQVNFTFLCNIPMLDEVPDEGDARDEFEDDLDQKIAEFEGALDGRIDSFNGSFGSGSNSGSADDNGILYGGAGITTNIYDDFGNIVGTGSGKAATGPYIPPNWRASGYQTRAVFGDNALS